ncbi:hypothetical protein [Lysobacter gummosus]|uniref:hypothetical protein n=1 Tax=Lysobacter gummosus TaxID=262324 RepID=UPI00362E0E02
MRDQRHDCGRASGLGRWRRVAADGYLTRSKVKAGEPLTRPPMSATSSSDSSHAGGHSAHGQHDLTHCENCKTRCTGITATCAVSR